MGGGGSGFWSSKRWFLCRLWAVSGVGLEWLCKVLFCVVVMEVMCDCEEWCDGEMWESGGGGMVRCVYKGVVWEWLD